MTGELLLGIVVVGLAAHRVARAVSVDTITDRLRSVVYRHAYTTGPLNPLPDGARDEDDARMVDPDWTPGGVETLESRPWSWVYGLVSCPHCCGWWLSLALWVIWRNWADGRVYLAAVAVAGLQSVVAAKGME